MYIIHVFYYLIFDIKYINSISIYAIKSLPITQIVTHFLFPYIAVNIVRLFRGIFREHSPVRERAMEGLNIWCEAVDTG